MCHWGEALTTDRVWELCLAEACLGPTERGIALGESLSPIMAWEHDRVILWKSSAGDARQRGLI